MPVAREAEAARRARAARHRAMSRSAHAGRAPGTARRRRGGWLSTLTRRCPHRGRARRRLARPQYCAVRSRAAVQEERRVLVARARPRSENPRARSRSGPAQKREDSIELPSSDRGAREPGSVAVRRSCSALLTQPTDSLTSRGYGDDPPLAACGSVVPLNQARREDIPTGGMTELRVLLAGALLFGTSHCERERHARLPSPAPPGGRARVGVINARTMARRLGRGPHRSSVGVSPRRRDDLQVRARAVFSHTARAPLASRVSLSLPRRAA